MEKLVSVASSKITGDYLEKNNTLKYNTESILKNTQKTIQDNNNQIKNEINLLVTKNNEILDKFFGKLIIDVIGVEQFYSLALGDILDGNYYINF